MSVHEPTDRVTGRIVVLKDYRNEALRYYLDERTSTVAEARLIDESLIQVTEGRRGVAGFGAWRDFGFLGGRRRLFLAIYSTGDALVLRVGRDRFEWPGEDVVVRRTTVFPRVKRFTVLSGTRPLFDRCYYYVDSEVWPDNLDICSYVARATRSRGAVAHWTAFWAGHAAGRDVRSQEFADELQAIARRADEAAGRKEDCAG